MKSQYSAFARPLLAIAALIMTCGASAQASTSYYVQVATASSMVRYIPSPSFGAIEISVVNAGVTQDVWYEMGSGPLDGIFTAMITTPKAQFSDFRLQCTNAVPVTSNQQVFYAGPNQNCQVQLDLQ